MRRVVLVLADGLRPDAITPTDMPSLDALSRSYTTALRATTIRPSRTVAALASLATGVAPKTHGLIEPGLGFLTRLPTLRPLARELTRGGVSSQAAIHSDCAATISRNSGQAPASGGIVPAPALG